MTGPIFIVGPPASGAELLAQSLARASGIARAHDGEQLGDSRERPLLAGSELQVSELGERFPDAQFVFITREPSEALAGADDPAAATEQWRTHVNQALDELERLAPDRWAVCTFEALLEDPRRELRRLCGVLDLRYDQALLAPAEELRRTLGATVQLTRDVAGLDDTQRRLRDLIAAPTQPAATPRAEGQSPFRSVSTGSFVRILRELQASLLISTYQAGRLVCARDTGALLNTHFRLFDKPMGIAVADGRIALGTRTEIFDYRNMPEVAPKIEPAGTHDACFLPRNRHVTGDILVHELAFVGGELWGVATAFSCLATFDVDHSFIPRWAPPFISKLATEDRCHLNGLAVVGDRVEFVTALGQSDEPGGWRAGKASGGCLISVPANEVVLGGLSMPHSPRWHEGRLWVLESGRGALITVDLDDMRIETIAELPGFTRGLAFAGELAFVGLSQIRESSTFGDLPLTERLEERVCGVWVVNVRNGQTVGFLRFEDLVQEVFEVALLRGARYPEIAEAASSATSSSFQLP